MYTNKFIVFLLTVLYLFTHVGYQFSVHRDYEIPIVCTLFLLVVDGYSSLFYSFYRCKLAKH